MTLKVLNAQQLPTALEDSQLKNRDKGVLSTLVLPLLVKRLQRII